MVDSEVALLEASLSPPSYSWAAPQSDPGLRAGPMVSTPPTEGSPVGPPMLEPRSVYNMEAKTTVAVNPTLEDIAQLAVDLQTEITPCSEEPRTPIASGCVAVEDAASYESVGSRLSPRRSGVLLAHLCYCGRSRPRGLPSLLRKANSSCRSVTSAWQTILCPTSLPPNARR